MNGCILPGTNIAVDFWEIRNSPCSNLTFFLTHVHGDHTVGLTSSWHHKIYCTEVSAVLLRKRYGIDAGYLHPLELDTSHLINTNCVNETTITVTIVDANHCPGAAMFLFEGDFGTILHTGDFRYDSKMLDSSSVLAPHIGMVDVLYMDNTFCMPGCDFPSRDVVREDILSVMKAYPTHDIIIGTRKLGKEDLLVWLAQNLQEWISVSSDMFSVIEILNMPRVLTTHMADCRIKTVTFQAISKKTMYRLNSVRPTIAILPTAIYSGIGGKPYSKQDDVFLFPYSDHSCFSELSEFVSRLKPAKIVPIVSGSSRGPFGVSIAERADMSIFDHHLCSDTDRRVHVPCNLTNSFIIEKKSLPRRRPRHINKRSTLKSIKGVVFQSLDVVDNTIKSTNRKEKDNESKEDTETNNLADSFLPEQDVAEGGSIVSHSVGLKDREASDRQEQTSFNTTDSRSQVDFLSPDVQTEDRKRKKILEVEETDDHCEPSCSTIGESQGFQVWHIETISNNGNASTNKYFVENDNDSLKLLNIDNDNLLAHFPESIPSVLNISEDILLESDSKIKNMEGSVCQGRQISVLCCSGTSEPALQHIQTSESLPHEISNSEVIFNNKPNFGDLKNESPVEEVGLPEDLSKFDNMLETVSESDNLLKVASSSEEIPAYITKPSSPDNFSSQSVKNNSPCPLNTAGLSFRPPSSQVRVITITPTKIQPTKGSSVKRKWSDMDNIPLCKRTKHHFPLGLSVKPISTLKSNVNTIICLQNWLKKCT